MGGLQAYKEMFDADEVAYHLGEWNSGDGDTYTSLIVQVPSTQMILELIQQTSLSYSDLESEPHSLEQRVPVHALRRYKANTATASTNAGMQSQAQGTPPQPPQPQLQGTPPQPPQSNLDNSVGSYLTPLVVNRAASPAAMSKLEDFYVGGMGTSKTYDFTDGEIVKKCFLWSGATVHICFTQRPDDATAGDWKVSDFEDMLNTVHDKIIKGYPFCGMDKWEDNHYAIDSRSQDTASLIRYINKENPYHYCESTGSSTTLHYVWDPTGWGIQLDLPFTSVPDDCTLTSTQANKKFLSRFTTDDSTTHVSNDYNPVCAIDLTVCPSV